MRFQLFILFGLACAYAAGALYTNHQAVDVFASAQSHQAVSFADQIDVQKQALRDGDILFQTSGSDASRAIQLATNSKYSHCGIVLYENGNAFVYEAVQPVSKTPLARWTSGAYVAKRLKNDDKVLTPDVMQKMKAMARTFEGKDYDSWFNWNDDKLYCSELVYKLYERCAGVKPGELKPLKDYDLSNALVAQQLRQRYGNNIPYNEPMISPGAIYDSPLLTTVEVVPGK